MTMLRTTAAFAVLIGLAFAGLIANGFTPLASAQDEAPAPTVRFAHVYSGGGPVDIYVDEALAVEQLAFGTATEYATVDEGERRIRVVATGEDPSAALIDTTMDAGAGAAYNVLVGGQGDALDARVHEVNLDALDPGMARIRFIQGAPDVEDANFVLAAPTDTEPASDTTDTSDDGMLEPGDTLGIGDNVPFGEAGDYQTVRAATYDILVQQSTSGATVLETPQVALDAGNVYDIVVLGQIETNNLTLLPLITTVSPTCSELLQVGQATDACVRLVHASPDAGDVDVYVDGTVVAPALSYGTATEFAPLADGEHQIQVVPAGGTVDGAVLDATIDFEAGQAYQFVVAGIAQEDDIDDNDLRIIQSEIDLTPLPAGQTRIRAIHAVDDGPDVAVALTVGEPLIDGLGFGNASDYAVIDAGAYDVQVTGDDDTVLLSASGAQLEAGMVYDAIVIGRAADNSLQLLVLTANAMPREGAQGTPLAVPATEESDPSEVEAGDATVVGGEGGEETPTPVGAAPVTPVQTPEATATST